MEQFERQGRLVYTRTGMPRHKHYLDEMPGVPLRDVWDNVEPAGFKKERLGYPPGSIFGLNLTKRAR